LGSPQRFHLAETMIKAKKFIAVDLQFGLEIQGSQEKNATVINLILL
jgi:hypothetical protein